MVNRLVWLLRCRIEIPDDHPPRLLGTIILPEGSSSFRISDWVPCTQEPYLVFVPRFLARMSIDARL